jgi:hypothetical protein
MVDAHGGIYGDVHTRFFAGGGVWQASSQSLGLVGFGRTERDALKSLHSHMCFEADVVTECIAMVHEAQMPVDLAHWRRKRKQCASKT